MLTYKYDILIIYLLTEMSTHGRANREKNNPKHKHNDLCHSGNEGSSISHVKLRKKSLIAREKSDSSALSCTNTEKLPIGLPPY